MVIRAMAASDFRKQHLLTQSPSSGGMRERGRERVALGGKTQRPSEIPSWRSLRKHPLLTCSRSVLKKYCFERIWQRGQVPILLGLVGCFCWKLWRTNTRLAGSAAGEICQEGAEKLHGAAVAVAGGAFSGQRSLSLSVSLSLFFLSVIHASNWIPWPAEQHLAAAAAAAKRRADCLQTANKRDACARRRCLSVVRRSVRAVRYLNKKERRKATRWKIFAKSKSRGTRERARSLMPRMMNMHTNLLLIAKSRAHWQTLHLFLKLWNVCPSEPPGHLHAGCGPTERGEEKETIISERLFHAS